MPKFQMLSISLVAILFCFSASPRCQAQGVSPKAERQVFPLEQKKSGVVMRLTRARWAKSSEFNYPQLEKDEARRMLAVWYEVERPDASDKDPALMRTRLFQDREIAGAQGEHRLLGRVDRGYFLYDSIDPRARRIEIECEVPRPKAPLNASGISEEVLDFGTLPVPAPDAGPLEIRQKRKTVLGTWVEIESVHWQPFKTRTETTDALGKKQTVSSEGRRIRFVVRVVPPTAPVTKSTVSLEYGLVSDATGKSLNPPPYYYDRDATVGADGRQRVELTATDDATRREINLKIKVREEVPSRALKEWTPVFRFSVDPSALPVTVSASEPPPPLASSAFAGGRVELESLRLSNAGIAGRWLMRLWTYSPLRSGTRLPPWVWTPDVEQARDDADHEWTFSFSQQPVYFHLDGSAIRDSENGIDFAFQSGDKTGQATKLDIKMRLIAQRRTQASFPKIPVPHVSGQVMPLRQVARDASGAQLILWKIGAFDAAHPTALTTPQSNRSSDNGIALVFEYRPIPDGAQFDRATMGEPLARDDKGVLLPTGVRFGQIETPFATANGDLLKAGREKDHWFTVLLPAPAPDVKTLSIETSVFERQSPESAPIVEWKAVPIPKPEP